MAQKLVHRGWAVARRLLTGLGAASFFSTSALANPISSAERLSLESRVQAVRQALKDSAPRSVQAEENESLSQPPGWGNWGNWGNWANAWNNWGNWGNWGNA